MKTLVLARHAKSDWNTADSDFNRPLNSRGQADAPMMGKLLKAYDFQADLIISSPAMRAKTTAQLVAREMGYNEEITYREGIYESTYATVLSIIQDLPETVETAMVFGHNPTTEQLARFFLQSQTGITMPTCGMICFEFNSPWNRINPLLSTQKWFLIPRLVKKFRP